MTRSSSPGAGDDGQATVELALSLPLLCLFLCGLVQVAVLARDRVAVQLAAREAARAAAVAADPRAEGTRAAERATTLRPLSVTITESAGRVTASVTYTDPTDVPLVGLLMPGVEVTATVTMAVEPP